MVTGKLFPHRPRRKKWIDDASESHNPTQACASCLVPTSLQSTRMVTGREQCHHLCRTIMMLGREHPACGRRHSAKPASLKEVCLAGTTSPAACHLHSLHECSVGIPVKVLRDSAKPEPFSGECAVTCHLHPLQENALSGLQFLSHEIMQSLQPSQGSALPGY